MTSRKVLIDKILYPIEDEWALFAGTDKNGKTWMWDYTSPDDVVWGNGGYPGLGGGSPDAQGRQDKSRERECFHGNHH